MNLEIFILGLALSGAVGVSMNEEDTDLYIMVDSLLQSARGGMTPQELGQAAETLQKVTEAIVESRGEKVETDDVKAEIEEAASSFNGAVAVSSLFDDPLSFESQKMHAALCLLEKLAEDAKKKEDAGEANSAALAAISMTLGAIQKNVIDTVALVIFTAEIAKKKAEKEKEEQQIVEESSNAYRRYVQKRYESFL